MSDEIDLDAEWRADRLAHRLNTIRNQRPKLLRDKGDLHPKIATWASALVNGTAGNLVIVGGVGVGKTWSIWEALESAVEAGYAGRILVSTSAHWQDTVGPPVDREQLRAMRAADVLALDDLGSTRINDWQRECLMSVIDERWQNGLPTAVTTNMGKLGGPLGERLASRILDGAVLVAINGEDRRESR